jgi:hypothetical protein
MSNTNENFIVEGKGYAETLGKGAVKIQIDGTISAADTRDMAHKLIFLADLASGAEKCEHGRIKDYCAVCLSAVQPACLPEGFQAANKFEVKKDPDGDYWMGAHFNAKREVDHFLTLNRTDVLNLVAWLMTKADIHEHELRLAKNAVALEVAKEKKRW